MEGQRLCELLLRYGNEERLKIQTNNQGLNFDSQLSCVLTVTNQSNFEVKIQLCDAPKTYTQLYQYSARKKIQFLLADYQRNSPLSPVLRTKPRHNIKTEQGAQSKDLG